MPYRRLPNTDISRLAALKNAYKQYNSVGFNDLAFDKEKTSQLRVLIQNFELSLIEYRDNYENQIKANQSYKECYKLAKTYISHFIQVLNMSVIRGEIKEENKEYYKLSDINNVPKINSEKDVLKWGTILIEGERNRTSLGGNPMTNPTIAMLRVKYDQFYDNYVRQKTIQKSTKRTQENVLNARKQVDDFIKSIWDDIEIFFKKNNLENWRANSQEYGVVYVYRPNELKQQQNDISHVNTNV